MITYGEIYEAARKERFMQSLQNLPKNFVEEVARYLKEKKQLSLNENDAFSDSLLKTKKQLENAITLFKELMNRRRKKILDLVLVATQTGISRQDFENMLLFEKELFEEIMKLVGNSDKKINDLLEGRQEFIMRNELVSFLEKVDEFVGFDEQVYGPYEKGEIANLPKDISKILVEEGKIEIIEK